VVTVEGDATASQAQSKYQAQRAQLDRELQQASAEGYSADDLAAIYLGRTAVAAPEPVWVGDRTAFYDRTAADASALRSRLAALKATLIAGSQKDAADRIADLSTRLQALQPSTDSSELAPLQAELDRLKSTSGAASRFGDLRAVVVGAQGLSDRVAQVEQTVKVEVDAIASAAVALKAQTLGDPGALAKIGRDALASGRNDATAATWLKVSGFDKPYRLLEHYAQLIDSPGVDQVATGAVAARRYADQIRAALIAGMPKQAILISMQGQELWAYQDGKLVQNTLVTTGKPPDLATDIGPMKVLSKQSPWKMHSPWPKGSPYWYPDTDVQMVLWFTNTGEGLHDAYWQSTPYGAGSQYGPSASHGCIHIPYAAERLLYGWAAVGTPVIVFPGDGTTLQSQLAQQTTDNAGNPLTGPKGA